jgi:hypothetical protein
MKRAIHKGVEVVSASVSLYRELLASSLELLQVHRAGPSEER